MTYYSIHVNETSDDASDFEVIPEGISYLAGFVTGPLWFAFHKLYIWMLADFLLLVLLANIFTRFQFTPWAVFVILLAVRFLVACQAYDILHHHLQKRGYKEINGVHADDLDTAESFALDQINGTLIEEQNLVPTAVPTSADPVHHRHRPTQLSPFATPFEN